MPFGLRADSPLLRRRPLAFAALFYAIGAYAGAGAAVPWWAFLAAGLVFWGLCIGKRRFSFACGALLFTAATLVQLLSIQPLPLDKSDAFLTGRIASSAQYTPQYAVFTLTDVHLDDVPYPHRTRLYLYRNGEDHPSLAYGDKIALPCSLANPRGSTSPYAYDSAAALWRKGISCTASGSVGDAEIIQGDPSPMAVVYRLREGMQRRIARLYPQNGPLAQALLLGDKSGLTEEEYAAFQTAGIVHLLAVSGLHITVLAQAVRIALHRLLRFSRKAAYLIELPLLLLFAAITGFPASILRAALCFALMEAAALFGRPADRLTGLSAAFLLLAIGNPLSLFDTGFQLSFAAILGLCLLSPVVLRAVTPANMLRTRLRQILWTPVATLCTSACVLLATLPICANAFGQITLSSLLTNIVAIPLASLILPFLLLSLWVGAMAVPLEGALSALSLLPEWVARLPFSLSVPMPRMHTGFVILYLLVALLCSSPLRLPHLSRRRTARIKLAGMVLLVAIACLSSRWVTAPLTQEEGLALTFIDVGQGDSILINAQGCCYMVDTGDNHQAASRLEGQAIPLKGLFLTHPDADHAGAAAEVIQSGSVDTVYLPSCWDALDIAPELAQALSPCTLVPLSAGDTLPLSQDVQALVLHPPKGYVPGGSNDASLVLLIAYGQGSALLTGDIADSAIHFPVPDCDILKLAHHASGSSSGQALLTAAAPSAAIVSVGVNKYGHPDKEVLSRLRQMQVPTFRTDQRGDITARIASDGSVTVECFLPPPEGD